MHGGMDVHKRVLFGKGRPSNGGGASTGLPITQRFITVRPLLGSRWLMAILTAAIGEQGAEVIFKVHQG
jgi:hypothetical protein